MQQRILRLHCDQEGRPWFGDDRAVAVYSLNDLTSYDLIRVPGTAGNVALLAFLLQALSEGRLGSRIEIGNPAVLGSYVSPHVMLDKMWQLSAAPAPGAWHELQAADYSSFALSAMAARDVFAQELLQAHPAWPAVSFAKGQLVPCSKLLATVLDPRLFFHPTRPGRTTRLNAFLGLTPKNVAYYHFGDLAQADRHYGRATLAIESWCSDTCGTYFHKVASERGTLTATKQFVRLVREVWLQARNPHVEIFAPSAFFKAEPDEAAYLSHISTLNRSG